MKLLFPFIFPIILVAQSTEAALSPSIGSLDIRKISSPSAPTVTAVGAQGSNTWTYVVVGNLINGTHSAAGAAGSGSGPGTLSSTMYMAVQLPTVVDAVNCDVYRTAAGTSPTTTGKITTSPISCGSLLRDTGLAGNSTTAPTTNTTGGGTVSGSWTTLAKVSTATAYTVIAADSGSFLTFSNDSGVAVTLPNPAVSTTMFVALACAPPGTSVATCVVTPAAGTINSAANYTMQNNTMSVFAVRLLFDGITYEWASLGNAMSESPVFMNLKSTSGTRYLCIGTDGVVTSSASVCSGT